MASGKARPRPLKPLRTLAGLERHGAEVAAVLDQHGDRHDEQHGQLEGEEEAGQLGRHGHAAEHHEHGAGGEDGGEDDPGDAHVEVELQHDRQEPAGDDQHRRDRDDVAGSGHQRGGHRAGTAERLAHEGDEAAGRRAAPGRTATACCRAARWRRRRRARPAARRGRPRSRSPRSRSRSCRPGRCSPSSTRRCRPGRGPRGAGARRILAPSSR